MQLRGCYINHCVMNPESMTLLQLILASKVISLAKVQGKLVTFSCNIQQKYSYSIKLSLWLHDMLVGLIISP